MFNGLFKRKMPKVTIECDKEVRWPKGLCLKAIETSSFTIPGGIFQKGIPIGSILEISDTEATIIMHEKSTEDSFPNMTVILKPEVKIKINKNCYTLHNSIEGQENRSKDFYIVEGSF